ncbi:NADP-dependent oxidoreductase [Edwardsiella hoshinae]|uniref:NADP-dependent oxidoreductase n=1 Tax=Edwardsiella hoshinae TaxID=93378 RepID=A0A376DJN4_9GAMM|nr:NADP-dependent oxidoreductase [Edwardsiella hoshinae]AOV97696.1 NADP-dependent oxidoreductase [Edwardsiella hoshinae]QPR29723.1 NADP-dependent oxidoreductase [Edwardsiella hoshinae]STC90530.1 NADPH-dependent curcumin reductase [Edwardsiella hoshinae]
MTQTGTTNRRLVLRQRPHGMPTEQDIQLQHAVIPQPASGQLLLRTLYLSIDPYIRGRMNDGPSYAPAMQLGDVMVGHTLCRVEHSQHPDYEVGEWVLAQSGWQDYALSDGVGLQKVVPGMAHPTWLLGVLGMPGFTGYMGLTAIGDPHPGETVVVSAASGAVGSVVGQVARLLGARAVGIAGGSEKCRYVRESLGLEECIDHRAPDFATRLRDACPNGIDVYYENVGGAIFDAVLPLLNPRARVPLCGLISQYNRVLGDNLGDRLPMLMATILKKRLLVRGFIIGQDFGQHYPAFYQQMSRWLAQGRIQYREDVVEGLEHAVTALQGLLSGKNFGKLLVKVAD